ncbi:hypothetical protein BC834DRAFT_523532 [Gloeopeniophorella convolvens]|nr:hypothetical protein BC834DRAFT_523532 [Gloeopeniophorella convolvens]
MLRTRCTRVHPGTILLSPSPCQINGDWQVLQYDVQKHRLCLLRQLLAALVESRFYDTSQPGRLVPVSHFLLSMMLYKYFCRDRGAKQKTPRTRQIPTTSWTSLSLSPTSSTLLPLLPLDSLRHRPLRHQWIYPPTRSILVEVEVVHAPTASWRDKPCAASWYAHHRPLYLLPDECIHLQQTQRQ